MKHGDKTKERIFKAGVHVWPDVTPTTVAKICGLTHSAILYYYPTKQLLIDAVAQYAVENKISAVIVQLIAANHAAIEHLTPGERSAHFFAV